MGFNSGFKGLTAFEKVHIPWSQTTQALIISSHIKKQVTKLRTPFCQDGVTGSVKTKQFVCSISYFCGKKTETILYNINTNSIHAADIYIFIHSLVFSP